MSCSTCSNSAFSCVKASFSMPAHPKCTLSSYVPAVSAHHFNLICPDNCMAIICPVPSSSHGVSSNAYNGYNSPPVIILPGHITSCPTCQTHTIPRCNCNYSYSCNEDF